MRRTFCILLFTLLVRTRHGQHICLTLRLLCSRLSASSSCLVSSSILSRSPADLPSASRKDFSAAAWAAMAAATSSSFSFSFPFDASKATFVLSNSCFKMAI
ncbi:hypothetical protein TorRG33x02_331610 [Trema orientale]|uniref:Secreted protein n=1 Tax=Trema orientale TaxID=63057 RepID=A0A2P5B5Y7_TREOI|nr:hypothetical protein TorRG33x02_331610 [Trema orientale]